MIARPSSTEAKPYFFRYIDLVPEDVQSVLTKQLQQLPELFGRISDERSLFRYAPGKWSIREVLNHLNDTERVFSYRALWFARGFESPLPSFDQDTGVAGAEADAIPWSDHVEEFRRVRLTTLSLLHHLPPGADRRSGIASGHEMSVRALAYMIAGHAIHHVNILNDKYLPATG